MSTVTLSLFAGEASAAPVATPSTVQRDATISKCGLYRYDLTRIWNEKGPRVCFVMLNPSTADAEQDDPTLRRCIAFARAWGYGSLAVVNLFALRATDPRDLKRAADPVGPKNDLHVLYNCGCSELVVLAWGNHGTFQNRIEKALPHIRPNYDAWQDGKDGFILAPQCLGMTGAGQPKHPLYLADKTPLIPFEPMEHKIK